MEKLRTIIRLSVKSLAVISFLSTKVHAQDLDKHQVENAVQTKEFVFRAQTVMPMSGGSKQLTTEYDVKFLEIPLFLTYRILGELTMLHMDRRMEELILLPQNSTTKPRLAKKVHGRLQLNLKMQKISRK